MSGGLEWLPSAGGRPASPFRVPEGGRRSSGRPSTAAASCAPRALSDGVPSGPWTFVDDEGYVVAEGKMERGRPSGTWRTREAGALVDTDAATSAAGSRSGDRPTSDLVVSNAPTVVAATWLEEAISPPRCPWSPARNPSRRRPICPWPIKLRSSGLGAGIRPRHGAAVHAQGAGLLRHVRGLPAGQGRQEQGRTGLRSERGRAEHDPTEAFSNRSATSTFGALYRQAAAARDQD